MLMMLALSFVVDLLPLLGVQKGFQLMLMMLGLRFAESVQ